MEASCVGDVDEVTGMSVDERPGCDDVTMRPA